MKLIKVIFLLTILCTIGCDKKDKHERKKSENRQKINPLALKMNNSAMNLYFNFINNRDSLLKADKLLNSALKVESASEFILNKISLQVALNKREEALKWCDLLIKERKLGFYPFLIKGNIYQKLHEDTLAEFSYAKAISILKERRPTSCNDLNFLIIIDLVKGDKKEVQTLLNQYKKMNCENVEKMTSMIKNFKKDEYLYGY